MESRFRDEVGCCNRIYRGLRGGRFGCARAPTNRSPPTLGSGGGAGGRRYGKQRLGPVRLGLVTRLEETRGAAGTLEKKFQGVDATLLNPGRHAMRSVVAAPDAAVVRGHVGGAKWSR